MLRSFDDEDEWSVEHIGKRSGRMYRLGYDRIDGAVEKFVWNEEDGIGFLIQDNSYLDFIKSSFTSRPVFAMQAADGRITYSTEDLMKEMWPKERIEDPVSVVAWRPYGFALQEDGSFSSGRCGAV